ncbi:unnamed protein product [Bursaphelenchus xylophilus]|uniref:(pine wood nematode) hypothetical protein n=1 Tax=Bursaphelenchus xylophilus TaxID=6326 RepID=A0A7I8X7U8_BURXY|nr:unnamed protein product [Bursaphelenchus xylophilus]CAG9126257.1 unnamed protein product [Bursaphelenchus xylophilus]
MWGQRKDVALSVAITSFLMLITFALLNPLTRPAPEIIEAGCPEIANTTTTTTTTTTTEAPVVERFGPTNVKEILPAFRNFQSQIRFADRYGLATCVIPKTMSTVMANVMCYLYDPQGFGKNNRSVIHDGFWTRFCEGLNEGNNISRIYSVHTSIDWQWFVVVRDPLDRFVSNYVDKCMLERRKTGALCYGCDDERDVECVLKNIEERGFRWAEKGDVFPDFFDAHLFPQNWQCDFGSFINKYEIIHFSPPKSPGYAAMLTQIMDIFRRKSVPPATLNLITEALNGTTTKHSTNDKPERAEIKEMIGRNTRLMRRIVNLYYFDYRLFGYPMPEGL